MVGRRLGRGLDFFLSGSEEQKPEVGTVEELVLGELQPSAHQPRHEFAPEELEHLSNSIRTAGVLQPILVRRGGLGGRKYEIVAGERRWRAAKMAGLTTVPAIIREVTDEQAAVFGLVENIHRTDLNAIERAKALRRIQAMTRGSQEDVARQVGLDRSTVANLTRLLDLPEEVQAHVSRGTLTMGHARALLGLATDAERCSVAGEVLRKKLSVRQVEALVQSLVVSEPGVAKQPGKSEVRSGKGERPLWLNEIEETLVEALGTQVTVHYGKKRARIMIECIGREEFERVYEKLKGDEAAV